jgi:hypothetical protein
MVLRILVNLEYAIKFRAVSDDEIISRSRGFRGDETRILGAVFLRADEQGFRVPQIGRFEGGLLCVDT